MLVGTRYVYRMWVSTHMCVYVYQCWAGVSTVSKKCIPMCVYDVSVRLCVHLTVWAGLHICANTEFVWKSG